MPDWRDKLRNPHCTLCALSEGTERVCIMGSGPSQSDIFIVGEAPGGNEEKTGQVFSGKAGQLLNLALEEYGHINRDDCYVSNVAKCHPIDNRTPERREAQACVEAYLWSEVAHVKPKFMLLLGNSALQGVLKKSGITKQAGTVIVKQLAGQTVSIMPTLHPAAILRNPKYAATFTADIAAFGRLVRGEKAPDVQGTKTIIVSNKTKLRELIDELMHAKVISYDIETYTVPTEPPYIRSNFQEWHGPDSRIVSISFSWEEGQASVVPLWHEDTPWKDPDAVLATLRKALTRTDCKYVGHNAKFDDRWLHAKGIKTKTTFDTMLSAHMLEENRPKGLKSLSRTILGVDAYDVGEDLGAANKMDLRRLCIYNGHDTDYTLRLYNIFRKQLIQDQRAARVFVKLMMPASNALVEIERNGVWIDPQRWQERHDKSVENVAKLYQYINQFVSPDLRPLNLRSPQQVARWLYGDLGLPVIEQTKTNNPSTREGVILELAAHHDVPALKALLKYRKWAKYLSTYLLPWHYEHMSPDGRIHTSYKLFGTVTGRLSGDGGMQQVPRDSFIRGIIGAPTGRVFIQADFSQAELRIAAMIAQEENMLRAYRRGDDIHMQRAMRITGKQAKDVTKEERKKAKAVNFGMLYGMGAKKFVLYAFESYDVRVTLEEAEAVRRGFFEDYPRLLKWHERQRTLARRYGVVYSPIGRARHLPDINSHDEKVRAEAERQAINSPVQGMASDLMLAALIEIHKRLNPKRAMIVGSIHDAILVEANEDYAYEAAAITKECMEDSERIEKDFGCQITVPIQADVDIGTHWSEGKEWKPGDN